MANVSLFEQLLTQFHKKILLNYWIKEIIRISGMFALIAAIIMLVTRFIVVDQWKALLLVTSILACFILLLFSIRKRPTFYESVKNYNEFIEFDYVITTYELNGNHRNYESMKEKTMQLMQDSHANILKIKFPIFNWKHLVLLVLCISFSIGSYLFPSETQLIAEKNYEIKELLQESEVKLEDFKKELVNEEDKELIDEMIQEMEEIETLNELAEQLEKLNASMNLQLLEQVKHMALFEQLKALQNNRLSSLQQSIQDGDWNAWKEDLQGLDKNELTPLERMVVEKLEQLNLEENEWSALASGELNNQMLQNLNQLSNEIIQSAQKIDSNVSNLQQKPISPEDVLIAVQSNSNGEQSNGTTSNTSGQLNPTSNSHAPNNEGMNSNSSGSGMQQGSGSGMQQGSGSGNESGSSKETNPGIGSGIGKGQGTRELTIPSRVNGEHSIFVDSGNLGEGEMGTLFESQGLGVKGEIQDYAQVLNAYDSINQASIKRTPLPQNLSELVKTYFSNIE